MDTKKKKASMIRSLKKHKGLVSTSCQAVKIARSTHYLWMDSDDEYKSKVDELMNLEVEYVESKLQNLIENENPSAIQFYLKNKSDNYRPTLDVNAEVSGELTINAIFTDDLIQDVED